MNKNLFLVLISIFSYYCYGQDWINYNTVNTQFPSNPYKTIKLDQQGNKWIGTQFKGIYKYDGTNWDIYNTLNSSLPSDQVKSISFDPNNNLWVCTANAGLAKLSSTGIWTIYNKVNSMLPANDVNGIIFDIYNNAWIATKDGLAFKDNTDNWVIFNATNSSIINNEILSIGLEYNNGQTIKWIGTSNGLIRYDDSNWEIYTTSNSLLTGNAVTNIHIDKNNNKWISVYNSNSNTGGGLIKIDSNNLWTQYNTANSNIPSNQIYTISSDSTDTQLPIWVGTDNGMAKLAGSAWTIYNTDNTQNGLLSNQIFSIALQGSIKWIGTDKLMQKFSGTAWTAITFLNSGIPDNKINDLVSSRQNNISTYWIGTSAGLSRFNGTNWSVYNMANSNLPSNHISSLCLDTGRIWIGTKAIQNVGGGLVLYDLDNQVWTVFNTLNSSLPSNNVTALCKDKQNSIWIGLGGAGLVKINSNFEWTLINENNSELSSNNIQALNCDDDNNIWISTDYGISVYSQDTQSWSVYNIYNSPLPSNNIRKINFSPDFSVVWIATDNGLTRKINQNWLTYKSSNSPLNTNNINDVEADSSGFIWIAGSNGLIKTDEVNWQTYNTVNSSIASNVVNNILLEYREGECFKLLSTPNNGISIFRKGNAELEKGIYLSVFQHPYLDNFLNINAFSNRIIADTVYMQINNVNQVLTYISPGHWTADYNTGLNSADLSLKFRVVNSFMDSTVTKTLSVVYITQNKRSGSSFDKKLIIHSKHNENDFVSISNDQGVYEVISSGHYRYGLSFRSVSKVNITGVSSLIEGEWQDIPYEYRDGMVYLELNCPATLKIRENEISKISISAENYPNPFRVATKIAIKSECADKSAKLSVAIYNIKGQLVRNLYTGFETEKLELDWNGRDNHNLAVGSGIYFLRIKSRDAQVSRKMLLIK